MTGNDVALSEQAEARLEKIISRYPDKHSAAMPALYIALEELGVLDEKAVQWVSQRVGLPPVHVRELVTFYTMYHDKRTGRYHIQICRTLSCAIRGARKITECIAKRFNLKPGEVSADGLFSYEEVECLGSCGTAPMCEINDTYFENLDEGKIMQILDLIEESKPNLSYSTISEDFGAGLAGYPKSQVLQPPE